MTRIFRSFREGTIAFLLLAFLGLIAAKLNDSQQNVYAGSFSAVDGDTLVLSKQRFRLKGIDAPEYRQLCQRQDRDWECGKASADALRMLLKRGDVGCRGRERDQYDRMLVFCTVAGIDINAELVRTGMAVSYGDYGREEAEARARHVGLWAGTFERPRDYRDEERMGGHHGFTGAVGFLKGIIGL